MKKAAKIIGILLLLLVLVIGGLAIWQRDNVIAAINGFRYTPEELQQQMEENQQNLQDTVDALDGITVRDMTEEERQALLDGEITQEELIQRLIGNVGAEQTLSLPSASGQSQSVSPISTGTASTETSPAPNNAYQEAMAALIARAYALRATYEGSLSALYNEAAAAYQAMPVEKRSKGNLKGWASSYISRANALEAKCDGEIDAITNEMYRLVSQAGEDESIVDTLINTYVNEKSLKKSWYISQMQQKGLI